MNEPFELPVLYQGGELLFPAQLLHSGYTHRFRVNVYGHEVFFEPDEEGSYRALADESGLTKRLTLELLQAIADAINTVLR